MKIKVAIAGGTGYTAGELLRILLNHPQVEITAVLSTTMAGKKISAIHRDLLGDIDLEFSSELPADALLDFIFLALGHGLSREYLDKLNLPAGCKVIDLGNDFRLDDDYNGSSFVYGLAELNKTEIARAKYIANPGCFATSILLPLAPLAQKSLLSDDVHIHAITGSTGAGKKLSETGHFSYRDNNISVYKPFAHQHLGEIEKTLSTIIAGNIPQINFVPMRGDFTRGIFTSLYTKKSALISTPELIEYYKKFYAGSPFVRISNEPISLKEVVNTNKALIHIEEHNGYWHFTSIIDNLLKGASGQAVQNMNIMSGLNEGVGLNLKATAF